MIPKECKRLAEVDFPIAEVSRHAAKEKSIRHGHPSTLHLWWARRPLASSRAVLMALLMPDPCDPHCPDKFKAQAKELLLRMRGRPSGWDSVIQTDEGLRQILLKFIADFANWDNAAKTEYLEISRGLVKAAHPEETPLVVDPFAGGGSIPLEALRLGCEVFASDLNPVACLILKVMLEDIPRHGPGLADELRKAGAEIKAKAEKELADLYTKDPDGATPIAYLWARTVRCEAPNCGAEIPLMRSMWLSKNRNRKRAFRPCVVRDVGSLPRVEFEIFEPRLDRDVPAGTVSRAKATCLSCRTVLSPERVRTQLAAQNGGTEAVFNEKGIRIGGARLTAIVILRPGQQGRYFRLPSDTDYQGVKTAQRLVEKISRAWEVSGSKGLHPIPDGPIPTERRKGNSGFRVLLYGMNTWGDLFSARQKVTLITLAKLVSQLDCSPEAKDVLALSISRFTDISNSLCRWENSKTQIRNLFTRQAIPMIWDFGEGNLFGKQAGDYETTLGSMIRVVERWEQILNLGQVQQADSTEHPLPDQSAHVWFTDPPYYDAIHYSDLADFFLAWLERTPANRNLTASKFTEADSPSIKEREIVQDEAKTYLGKTKDSSFFENQMTRAFGEMCRVLNVDGVGAIVFAHRTTDGWEALLSGMIRGGLTITGSWPIATESETRPNARDNASLATSIHLVCRPRPQDAQVGEWSNVLRELPVRVGDWMQRLQQDGVRGADLVFACIGPALEIYSRYSAVETPEGRQVELPEYLERVWEVVAREALEQVLGTAEAQARNGAAGALEEDARLTALFLWTLQSTDGTKSDLDEEEENVDGMDTDDETPRQRTTGFSMPFDVARRFAQPLGIHLEEWDNRITQTEKGVVKLRPVTERAKELFGDAGADSMADEIEASSAASAQLRLFPEEAPTVRGRARRGRQGTSGTDAVVEITREPTTLDRLHAGMLLQASGRTEALRTLIRAEQERGPDFLRLANALTALYPRGSDEKRLLDGMLLAAPR